MLPTFSNSLCQL